MRPGLGRTFLPEKMETSLDSLRSLQPLKQFAEQLEKAPNPFTAMTGDPVHSPTVMTTAGPAGP